LKVFDKSIIQHTIELIEDAKLVRKKQRAVNPKIEVEMKQEVLKLYKVKIIYPIKHSTWVANLVPIRKKNGEIQLCVYFRGLNRVSMKDHYPLHPMEKILNTVVGSKRFSVIDGFSDIIKFRSKMRTSSRLPS